MKSVNIISSLMGAGLHREALLLQDLLATHGHTSRLMHYTDGDNAPMERADINISLEVVMPKALSLARENWLAPNSEWWSPTYDQYLSHFSKILCKTRDCFDIWSKKVGESRCVYTSFEARDLYRADIPRQNRFLHVAGKSGNKGTNAVLRAWQQIPNGLLPLTVVASNPEFKVLWEKNHSNIEFFSKVDDSHLIQLMNSHRYHIAPSPYEGFGHAQHEGLGCGAFVTTVAAPPMNDLAGNAKGMFPLIPVAYQTKQRLATMSFVTPESIRQSCLDLQHLIEYVPGAAESHMRARRRFFLENRDFFRNTFMRLVESV
jgi:hypothetical protein